MEYRVFNMKDVVVYDRSILSKQLYSLFSIFMLLSFAYLMAGITQIFLMYGYFIEEVNFESICTPFVFMLSLYPIVMVKRTEGELDVELVFKDDTVVMFYPSMVDFSTWKFNSHQTYVMSKEDISSITCDKYGNVSFYIKSCIHEFYNYSVVERNVNINLYLHEINMEEDILDLLSYLKEYFEQCTYIKED